MIQSIVNSFGIVEEVNISDTQSELPTAYTPEQYSSRVAELIACEYSFADEGAFIANYARVTSGIETDPIKAKQYTDEFLAFQEFRAGCKAKAKNDCGL